ncbi:hypothetical protein [Thalassobellus suaedae]|uniref:Glycine dehydrogenase n=1 Tax=Thalassobellus suaedae TaxID=3074124 RepID=A0ABY9XQ98_9FLAO|nr:hypothetical protein RHP51_13125 [Flavobacteriaceae bacterium HL-DH14]WNH13431.1 hypothetical protein RHP49_04035 [Flavobacteriaceae bacterium HL-DH10]
MSKKVKVVIPCDEANHVCDKTQYKEASFWEMIKLNIHLIYCRACRKYTKNNALLTKSITNSKVECLNKDCKEKMKQKLEKAIKEETN